VAISAEGKFKYPTGKEGATALGYDKDVIEGSSRELLNSFCGVGNPFSIGVIELGEWVLDIGNGAGFDLIVASGLVGESGRVCGIDLTEDMVDRARKNVALAGVSNVEIQHIEAEEIPYEDQTFDVVTSNGVINLSPCKGLLFKEILRVLKPGGRLQFADIILKKELPDSLANSPDAWSQ
jgi:arsenite methyltransferase